MKNFSEYAKQTQENTKNPTAAQNASAEELTRKIASAYNGKSNADMLRAILAEAEKSKKAGTLSNEEIENFYRSFAPMLDSSQRKRLRTIVDKLKQME